MLEKFQDICVNVSNKVVIRGWPFDVHINTMMASKFQRTDCLNMGLDAKMHMCIVQKLVQMHLMM